MSHLLSRYYKDNSLGRTQSKSFSSYDFIQLKKANSNLEQILSPKKRNGHINFAQEGATLLDNRSNFYRYKDIPCSKSATKSVSKIASFSVVTNNGTVRNYNEDRVSIIINAKNPNPEGNNTKKWPSVSYFAIFDGHSGNKCADFLKENLHNFVCFF
jgi:hypothetical protein